MKTLTKRILSSIVYVVLLAGSLLWCKYSLIVMLCVFTGVMMHEFMRMTMGNAYRFSQQLTIAAGILFILLVWGARAFEEIASEYIFLSLIPLLVVMVNSLYVKDKAEFGKFANVYTALMYIAIPFSFNIFLAIDTNANFTGALVLCIYVLIWVSDAGAYIFGSSLGQKYGRKLFPSISPKKSWIGFWGGMLVCVLSSLALYYAGAWEYASLHSMTWYHAVGLALVVNVAGVYGDLFESQWKRHYGIKDSGNVIPGHGGLLDRLDSTLFAIPIGMIYLILFNLIEVIM